MSRCLPGADGHLQQDRLDQPDLGDAHSKVPHRAAVPDAPGDIGTELYIIKQGKVAIEIDKDDGTKLVVAESGPAASSGILPAGPEHDEDGQHQTITNCIIFELKQRDMEKVWEKSPTLKMYMLAAKEHLGRRKSSKKKEEPLLRLPRTSRASSGEEGAPVNFPSTSSTSSTGSKWMSKTKSRKSSGGRSKRHTVCSTNSQKRNLEFVLLLKHLHQVVGDLQRVLVRWPGLDVVVRELSRPRVQLHVHA